MESKIQQIGKINTEIEIQNQARYLGVIINDKLTWISYVDQVCGKLNLACVSSEDLIIDAAKTVFLT